jgi:hypothetical protein
MKALLARLLNKSVTRLTRTACWLALVGLGIMSYSIVVPRPLPVVFAMSVGQGIGILAFLCYLLAVVIDVSRQRPSNSVPPPRPALSAESSATPSQDV